MHKDMKMSHDIRGSGISKLSETKGESLVSSHVKNVVQMVGEHTGGSGFRKVTDTQTGCSPASMQSKTDGC